MENTQTSKQRQSDVEQMNKGIECILDPGKVAGDDATGKKDDTATESTLN